MVEKWQNTKEQYTMEDLLELMAFLRSEKGCPWDKEQTHESIKHNLVEEAYEVIDAIESGNNLELADELGDMLLQVVFHSRMAEEEGKFDFNVVLNNICKKLVSRHTHLFGEDIKKGESVSRTPEEVIMLWEKNKTKEKNQKSRAQSMKEITKSLPALMKAFKIQKKAAQAGFDWEDKVDVAKKIQEEMGELAYEVEKGEGAGNKKEIENELGDLLFAVVNYSRFLGIDPEVALDGANKKFIRRFEKLENNFKAKKREMSETSLEDLDKVWEEIKLQE